jgi:Na+/proline symporter
LAGLLVPLVLGLYWPPRSSLAALGSMLGGFGVWLVHYVAGWDRFLEPIPYFETLGLPFALGAAAVSLLAWIALHPMRGRG